MRALKIENRTLALVSSLPEPVLAPGEALIHPTRVLIGPADVARAARLDVPGVLGHQFVGVVKKVSVPADASGALLARKGWVGRRVVASPALACAACDLCRSGLSGHCRSRKVLGIHERDGCCAELFTIPLTALHLVPDKLSDDSAVFAGLLASAAHASNMLKSEGHSFITVLGDSPLALLTAQVLSRKNTTVRLLTNSPVIARLCEKWGIKQRGTDDPGRRQDQDIVVDCTGSSTQGAGGGGGGLRLALQLVRPRGIVLLKSPLAHTPFPPGKPFPELDPSGPWARPVDLTPAIVNEVQIIGSRDGPVPDALALLVEGTFDITTLVSRRFKLDEAAAACSGLGDALASMIEL